MTTAVRHRTVADFINSHGHAQAGSIEDQLVKLMKGLYNEMIILLHGDEYVSFAPSYGAVRCATGSRIKLSAAKR